MAEHELDAQQIEARVHDLREAMDRVRRAQADRDDVVVEMRQAVRSRLELLAHDLQDVFNDVPEDDERFDFALTQGETPRLWVDMTTHVRMSRDKRTYEFVKDTRLGRTILGASESRSEIARIVTDYVAERILERERSVEGDWQSLRAARSMPGPDGSAQHPVKAAPAAAPGARSWLHLITFLIGIGAGAAAMALWAGFLGIPGN